MSTATLDAGLGAPFRADLRRPLYNLPAGSVPAASFRFAAPIARNSRLKPPLQGARPRCCGNSTIFCVDKPSVHDMLCRRFRWRPPPDGKGSRTGDEYSDAKPSPGDRKGGGVGKKVYKRVDHGGGRIL